MFNEIQNSIFLEVLFVLIILYFIFGILRFFNKILIVIFLFLTIFFYLVATPSMKQKMDQTAREIILKVFKIDTYKTENKVKNKIDSTNIKEKLEDYIEKYKNQIENKLEGNKK